MTRDNFKSLGLCMGRSAGRTHMVIRPQCRKQAFSEKLDCNALQSLAVTHHLRNRFAAELNNIPESSATEEINAAWKTISSSISRAAGELMGFTKKHHHDWFDGNAPASTTFSWDGKLLLGQESLWNSISHRQTQHAWFLWSHQNRLWPSEKECHTIKIHWCYHSHQGSTAR